MFRMFNSIGKKISFIGIISLMTIILLAIMTLSFFGKLSEVGDITKKAYQYESLMKETEIEYNRMIVSSDGGRNEKLIRLLSALSMISGRISKTHALMEKGNSPEEAMDQYARQSGDTSQELRVVISLLESLEGTDILPRMVKNSKEGHLISTTQLSLVKSYHTADIPTRQQIIAQYNTLDNKGKTLLEEFHSIMDAITSYFYGKIKTLFIFICISAVLFISILMFFVIRSITGPLKETVDYVKTISEGNFDKRLKIKSSDELGIMVENMNHMSSRLQEMIKQVKNGIVQLNQSASDLTGLSEDVSEKAVHNSQNAHLVSGAAQEMSRNMGSVAASMAASTENTSAVVVAVEEMTATINEIAQNTDVAKNITDKAVEQSKTASGQMTQLGRMTDTIGKVTETITEISEQTNLLSLNATIEAARAGEAGKGFAVVANEIKELAKQTSAATLDIKEQISQIQFSTHSSVEEIDNISGVIVEISQIVVTIAAAIEEQSIATREIAQNMTMVSNGISGVNSNIGQSSQAVDQITKSITDVETSTKEMGNNSRLVKTSAETLSDLSGRLNEMMARFAV